jgi:bifunctional non-homologous end joining protein LigD
VAATGPGTIVTIEGRTLGLSNLDKNLYPEAPGGFTKGQMIDYYVRIAPVMLPHLMGRACTMVRFPDGVAAKSFFAKNLPSHAPDWFPRAERNEHYYGVVNELAALVWTANMAAIELHIPMHRDGIGPDGTPPRCMQPDRIVFDLDPGPGTDITQCSQVAQLIRTLITPLGFTLSAKTSGSKGMQLYATPPDQMDYDGAGGTTAFARRVAEGLEQANSSLVVSKMTKDLRPGKVLIDWSQNIPGKTTVAVYSLRARTDPTVSTPVTWAEVDAAADGHPLRFTADQVLERVATMGDLFGAPWFGAAT